jgi:hypothetical protein
MKSKSLRIFLSIVAVALILAGYYYRPDLLPRQATPAPPSPSPAVLSGQTIVEIGKQTKMTGCVSDGVLPDSACTPGAIDPKVTEQLVNGTICVSGYSSDVRPSSSVTNKIKVSQLLAYGFPDTMSDYELDHLISLELGGCPDCVANLWPEPYNIAMGARQKDKVENYLHKEVCNGDMTLEEAQTQIATDWTAVYYRVYGK